MRKKRKDRTASIMIVVMIVLTALTSYLFNISVFTNTNNIPARSPNSFQPLLVLMFLAFAVSGIGGWFYALKKTDRHR